MANFSHDLVWEEDSNVLLSVGMGFNDNILINMKKNALELLSKEKKIEKDDKKNKIYLLGEEDEIINLHLY